MSAETEPLHVRRLLAAHAENIGLQVEALEVYDRCVADGMDPWEAVYEAFTAYDDLDRDRPAPPTVQ